jgi:hypothetical protein
MSFATNKYDPSSWYSPISVKKQLILTRTVPQAGSNTVPQPLLYDTLVSASNLTFGNNATFNYDNTTGIFRCPISGILSVSCSNTGNSSDRGWFLFIMKNSSAIIGVRSTDSNPTNVVKYNNLSATFPVTQGDQITVQAMFASTEAGALTWTVSSIPSVNGLNICYVTAAS